MARVNVSKRSSTTTPKSLSAYRKTSNAPAPIAPRTWGSTTVRNTAAGPRPSRRALSSSDGDSAANAAKRRRNGRSVRVVTQASAVPTTAVDTAVAAARPSVLRSGTRVVLDVYRSASASSPVAVRHARYTSGVANSAPMTAQTTASVAGGRVRLVLTVEATLV